MNARARSRRPDGAGAKKPVFYTGGGVINSGPRAASQLLRELVRLSGYPDHLDADGPRRLPGLRQAVAGHARHARHLRGQPRHARLRRDDRRRRALRRPHHRPHRRLLARISQQDPDRYRSRPRSTRTSRSTSPSSATSPTCSRRCCASGKSKAPQLDKAALKAWWKQIDHWRARKSLSYKKLDTT